MNRQEQIKKVNNGTLRPFSVGLSSTQLSRILRTVPVECHGNDTSLIFHDTPLFSLLVLLVHVSKFNIHDTPSEMGLNNPVNIPGQIKYPRGPMSEDI